MAKSPRIADMDAPTGGVSLPHGLRRKLAPLPTAGASPLVKHIQRLKALHPEIHLKFRDVKLTEMDESTLRLLLANLNEQLGVD